MNGPAHVVLTTPSACGPSIPDPTSSAPSSRRPTPTAAGHRGVDLAGSPGQAVHASLAGTVGFAGSIGGKPVVTVVHGGRRTTYEPVVASVERGQAVAAGDVLGRLVITGSHCFPAACLHWGLIEGDGDARTYLDPLSLVGGGPVRLLPLWRDPSPSAPPASPAALRPADPASAGARCGRGRGLRAGRSRATIGLRRGGGPAGTPDAAGRS